MTSLTKGKWDIHNHILYGIDDGSSNMDETIELLKSEYKQGVRNIIFTPHYRKGMFETPFSAKEETYRLVCEKYKSQMEEKYPGMKFYLGCEYHVHPSAELNFTSSKFRMAGKDICLIEFSGSDNIKQIIPVLESFSEHNIRCIIAHVERYHVKAEEVKLLRQKYGAMIQLNASCVLGEEGLFKKILARKILSMEQADFIASDAHNTEDRPVLMKKCSDFVSEKYGYLYMKKIFLDNADMLFGESNDTKK